MPTHDMETMTPARTEEEIVRQQSILSNLHTQRNSHSFVSRLPNEILATIFVHYACDYYYCHLGYPTRTAPNWVNVSYVCRHWRSVALNCATLWTHIFITSRRWTEELLARSKQASLKIRVKVSWLDDVYRWLNSVDRVIDHVERIQELRLYLPATCANQVLLKLSSPAPRLQNLEILVRQSRLTIASDWHSVLFQGDTPSLRTLELLHCPVPWYSFKLTGLTALSLRCVPVRFQQNMEDFLVTLSRMQGLTYLYLDGAFASAAGFLSSVAFRTFQKFDLPHLSHFLIAAPLSTVTAFLSCVNIPLKTEIRLKCDLERDSSLDDYALLSSLLAQRYNTTEDQVLFGPIFRSLVIYPTMHGATLTFSTFKRDRRMFIDIWPEMWNCNVPLQVVLDILEIDTTDRIISDLCCSMPSTNVQSLHVAHPPFSPSFWRRTLGHFQNLQYIKLSSGNMPDLSMLSFPAAITHENTENPVAGNNTNNQDQDDVLVQGLEEIELNWITFLLGDDDDDLPEPNSLFNAIATRCNCRLSFVNCRIGVSELADRFSLSVSWVDGDVHVDRGVRYDPDSDVNDGGTT